MPHLLLLLLSCASGPDAPVDSQDNAAAVAQPEEIPLDQRVDGPPTAPIPADAGPDQRRFTLTYAVTVPPLTDLPGPIDLFLPVPSDDDQQKIAAVDIESTVVGQVYDDGTHGNRYWHARLDRPSAQPLDITMKVDVERRLHRLDPSGGTPRALTDEERTANAVWLAPGRLVPVGEGDPITGPVLAEVRARATKAAGGQQADTAVTAQAIYDWVVDNVEYKKVGTGWGNGDTFWACTERYGNCTDFHSLILSLARTENIPGRFEMGFPVPLDAAEGEIAGYHCWMQLMLPGIGWLPLDASEAAKHPEKRALYYGTHPADRVTMSVGRDLRLGEHHRGGPLNYFVFPYVEADGAPIPTQIETRVSYAELPLPTP